MDLPFTAAFPPGTVQNKDFFPHFAIWARPMHRTGSENQIYQTSGAESQQKGNESGKFSLFGWPMLHISDPKRLLYQKHH
jgi:hypothetical protein